MKVLVTRPEHDSAATIRRLAARGIEALAAPVLEVRPVSGAALPATCRAVLFTSANAPRALSGWADVAALAGVPVYAVGDRTAAAARDAGFRDVRSAAGDVRDLVRLVRAEIGPDGGPLLHPSGRDVAGDLVGDLQAAGIRVDRVVVYETVPAERLPAEATAALAAGRIGAVLFYSPKSAKRFAALAADVDLSRLTAVVISANVAENARLAGFGHISVADRPEESALFAALERFIKMTRQE